MSDQRLSPGAVVPAAQAVLEALTADPADVVSGSPRTSVRPLLDYGGVEIGLWEMSEGAMTDVEVDEVFVVLGGRATVVIAAEGGQPERELRVGPGDIVRLTSGMRTVWTVHETLRKLYVAPPQR